MRLAVFGATGRLGLEVLRAARARNLAVAAHRRSPPSPAAPSAGGVDWVGELPAALAGAGAAILVFGPRHPAEPPFCARLTRAILDAALECRLQRLLCVTGAMAGDYPANRTWCFELLTRYVRRRYPALMEDRRLQEDLVAASGLAWTIFKPPRLTMFPAGARLETGADVRVGLFSLVSRADLAALLVEDALGDRFPQQAVFLRTR